MVRVLCPPGLLARGTHGAVTPCPSPQVNVEDTVEMLPKSRRALTIQEIAALARSSLHGNCWGGPGAVRGWGETGEGCGLPRGADAAAPQASRRW